MNTIYLPVMPTLKCDANGHISFKQMDEYFRIIGSIPNQLRIQAGAIAGDCIGDLLEAIKKIEKLINEIVGFLMTDVFKKIKSLEQEMELKVREFFKEIDIFFQKKIIEIIVTIIDKLGIPNPLKIPIPFLANAVILDDDAVEVRYSPVLGDLFTKEGKVKVKAALADKIDQVNKFFGDDGAFDGTFGVASLEHRAEVLWHKLLNWLKTMLNNWILSAVNSIINILKKIPVIGQLISAIAVAYDPTLTLDENFELLWDKMKKDVKKAKEDFISGKTLKDLSNKIIDTFINSILSIQLPFVGSVGELLGVVLEAERSGKFKIIMLENLLHKIKDGWKDAMEKIRKFIHGGFIKTIHDIILKAPAFILKNFPIIGVIFAVLDKIVKFISGQNPITVCDVLNIILKPIFNLGNLITAIIPNCIHVEYTEYGLPPGTPQMQV